jgi:hypothetical protein
VTAVCSCTDLSGEPYQITAQTTKNRLHRMEPALGPLGHDIDEAINRP